MSVHRRTIAPFIRARQEVWKRIERRSAVAQWRGPDDTLAVLEPASLARLPRPDSFASVARAMRASVRERFPVAHLALRDPASLPDASRVVAHAERIVAGDWDIFDRPLRVTASDIDWRAHPFSGVRTPALHFSQVSYAADKLGGDVKFLWEVNRHAELQRLGQAYWLTRRHEFVDVALTLLDTWIDQNPPAIGINWAATIDVGFRAIAWCWLWALTADSDAWTDVRVGRLLWTVAHAGKFIARYDSVHHSPNTHLTGEALGLVYIGTVFPGLRHAADWHALGVRILREEVSHQFLDDGMHYERCTGYHRYNLEFYLHALAIARANGETWAEEFVAPLARGARASVALRRPDGTWPVLGDEDGGAAARLGTRDITDQSELLAVAAGLLGQPSLPAGVGNDAASVGWWILNDAAWRCLTRSLASEATEPEPSTSLRTAGYFTARDRDSGEAWYCTVDAGPHGGNLTGHAHTDLGHVEIAHGSRAIVVDPGCPVYTSEPERRSWFRGQRAHAGIMIDDVPLAIPSTAFGWRTVAPTPSVESIDRDAYWSCRLWYAYPTPRGAVSHERQVVLVRGHGVIVCDLLEGSGPRTVVARWPLGDRCTGGIDDGQATLVLGYSRISWDTSGSVDVVASIDATKRSPKFGVERDASTLVLKAADSAMPLTIVTTFGSTAEPPPRIRLTANGVDVSLDAGRVTVTFRPGVAPTLWESNEWPNAASPHGPRTEGGRGRG